MANFDDMIKDYSYYFASELKGCGITRNIYRSAFGTGFTSRMFFFENVASVEKIRANVRRQVLLDEYAESLTPVEMVFIENYNNIATLLNLPLYQKDVFLQRIKEQGDRSYYNRKHYFISNRAELFAVNPHITALVKNTEGFKDAENIFERGIKNCACNIITEILQNADRNESFWE